MILPATYLSGLLLMILAIVCAGSWTSTFKAANPYRYELYYFDFSFGAILTAVVAAFTLGSLRANELTFQDNFLIAANHPLVYGVVAGIVFNLGNVIMLAGASVGGVALCVPLSFGIALAISTTWDFISDPRPNALFEFGGIGVVLIALILLSAAYLKRKRILAEAAKKAFTLDPRSKEAKRKPKPASAAAGIALAILGGIFLGVGPHYLSLSRGGDGVAPYGLTLLFTAGLFLSTLLYSPFIMNFPIGGGAPAAIADYFRGGAKAHFLGLFGGMLFTAALLAANMVMDTGVTGMLGPALVTATAQAGPLLAILWGLLIWKEFRDAGQQIYVFVWGGFLLYAVGVALVALAPLYGSR